MEQILLRRRTYVSTSRDFGSVHRDECMMVVGPPLTQAHSQHVLGLSNASDLVVGMVLFVKRVVFTILLLLHVSYLCWSIQHVLENHCTRYHNTKLITCTATEFFLWAGRIFFLSLRCVALLMQWAAARQLECFGARWDAVQYRLQGTWPSLHTPGALTCRLLCSSYERVCT